MDLHEIVGFVSRGPISQVMLTHPVLMKVDGGLLDHVDRARHVLRFPDKRLQVGGAQENRLRAHKLPPQTFEDSS